MSLSNCDAAPQLYADLLLRTQRQRRPPEVIKMDFNSDVADKKRQDGLIATAVVFTVLAGKDTLSILA